MKANDDLILSQIELTHGQAKWVLRNFNMLANEGEASFDTFLKSLRRDGVPFSNEELGVGAGHNLAYRFEHLMELAFAMTLRTNGVMSREIVRLIEKNRKLMRLYFRRAYLERETGDGKPVNVFFGPGGQDSSPGKTLNAREPDLTIRGVYLDLSLVYLPSGSLNSLNFELLNAKEAVKAFMAGHRNLYPRPPIPISDIASDIVRLARGPIPEFKRGRTKA